MGASSLPIDRCHLSPFQLHEHLVNGCVGYALAQPDRLAPPSATERCVLPRQVDQTAKHFRDVESNPQARDARPDPDPPKAGERTGPGARRHRNHAVFESAIGADVRTTYPRERLVHHRTVWYSEHIAKMDCAEGRTPRTTANGRSRKKTHANCPSPCPPAPLATE